MLSRSTVTVDDGIRLLVAVIDSESVLLYLMTCVGADYC